MRDYMLNDIMDLLSRNSDVHHRYYRYMTREHFDKYPDTELVEAYKYVVMRCFRQR